MNGQVHNKQLADLLARRKLRIQDLGVLIPGGMSRTHLSLVLNGVRPQKAPTGSNGPKPLTKTWRLLRGVLTAEEFASALRFANQQRERLGLPVFIEETEAVVLT